MNVITGAVPNWAPLSKLCNCDALEGWTWKGALVADDGARIEIFKHRRTRRYFNRSAKGIHYVDSGHGHRAIGRVNSALANVLSSVERNFQ